MKNTKVEDSKATLVEPLDFFSERAEEILVSTNSTDRLPQLLKTMAKLPPLEAIELFKEVWSSCDSTYPFKRNVLLGLMKRRGHFDYQELLSADERAWLDKLPDRFPIYRGCELSRIDGVSWTTDFDIAAGFAIGHRGISVREPVVISGMIRKSDILLATNDRQEFEVLARFDWIEEKRVTPYLNDETLLVTS